jgi:hypothetical protein
MHLVASDQVLDCQELMPTCCDSINVDLSVAEVLASGGYGYIALVAYDVEGITGAEFAITGWPSGRGAPVLVGPTWCEDALSLGDHGDGGGITAFEACVEPDSTSGIAVLAYWSFGPLDSTDLPIELNVAASTYSDEDSLLVVLDCTVNYEQDDVVAVSGCTVGGIYSGTAPDCSGEEDGGGGGESGGNSGSGSEDDSSGEDDAGTATGFHLQFLGPALQRAVDSGALFCLRGTNLAEHTQVWLSSGQEVRQCTLLDIWNEIAQYRATTTEADSGLWNIFAANEGCSVTRVEGCLCLVPSLSSFLLETGQADWAPGVVNVKFRRWGSPIPQGVNGTLPEAAADASQELSAILEGNSCSQLERIFRLFPDQDEATPISHDGEVLQDENLARFVRLEFPVETDIVEVMGNLEVLPEVLQVWPSWPKNLATSWREPDDSIYVNTGQWPLYSSSVPYADIDAPSAWGRDTVSTEIIISINDTGVQASHEDLGGPGQFPNWKVIGGWDFVDDDSLPDEPAFPAVSHGTAMAGVAAATTDNGIGMAGVAWGDAHLLAVRMTEAQYGLHQYSAQGIDYSRTHGADVVCMGYNYDQWMPDEAAAVRNAHYFGEILCISAAGFSFCSPTCLESMQYPAGYPGVLGVTQSNEYGNFAGNAHLGNHVDLTAPGKWLIATSHVDGKYAFHSGTSLAAAHTAGVAAMVKSLGLQRFDPLQYQLYPEDLTGVILASVDPLQNHWPYSSICCGRGLLNGGKAMARLQYPFNAGDGPKRRVAYGADDSTLVRIFRPHPESDTLYYEYRVSKLASFGTTEYDSVFAWGYHRGFTSGVIPGAHDEDEMHWQWCRVIPTTISSSACSLEAAVYLRAPGGKPDAWIPCHPGGVTWWFGVSGIPLNLSVDSEPAEEAGPSLSIETFPNPFNPHTRLRFTVPRDCRVRLDVYDVEGRHVRSLMNEQRTAGKHEVAWLGDDNTGKPVAGGVYFCRLEVDGAAITSKLVVLR